MYFKNKRLVSSSARRSTKPSGGRSIAALIRFPLAGAWSHEKSPNSTRSYFIGIYNPEMNQKPDDANIGTAKVQLSGDRAEVVLFDATLLQIFRAGRL